MGSPLMRRHEHHGKPLADPANKLSYIVMSPGSTHKKVITETGATIAADYSPKGTAFFIEDSYAQGEYPQELYEELERRSSQGCCHHHHEHEEAPGKKDKKAIKKTIESAAVDVSAKKFLKIWQKGKDSKSISKYGSMEAAGCYVILKYPKGKDVKPAKYEEAFVGSAPNMGVSVWQHLTGAGNPNIYADVKYKQNVRVLMYPYPESKLLEKSRELTKLLQSDQSYNKR